jgi:hypothetical protein
VYSVHSNRFFFFFFLLHTTWDNNIKLYCHAKYYYYNCLSFVVDPTVHCSNHTSAYICGYADVTERPAPNVVLILHGNIFRALGQCDSANKISFPITSWRVRSGHRLNKVNGENVKGHWVLTNRNHLRVLTGFVHLLFFF